MMRDLPHGPTARAVRRVELRIIEPGDRFAEVGRRRCDLLDPRSALLTDRAGTGVNLPIGYRSSVTDRLARWSSIPLYPT